MVLQRAFKALSESTHLYGRRLVLEWAETDDDVETLRQKTAKQFSTSGVLCYSMFIYVVGKLGFCKLGVSQFEPQCLRYRDDNRVRLSPRLGVHCVPFSPTVKAKTFVYAQVRYISL